MSKWMWLQIAIAWVKWKVCTHLVPSFTVHGLCWRTVKQNNGRTHQEKENLHSNFIFILKYFGTYLFSWCACIIFWHFMIKYTKPVYRTSHKRQCRRRKPDTTTKRARQVISRFSRLLKAVPSRCPGKLSSLVIFLLLSPINAVIIATINAAAS